MKTTEEGLREGFKWIGIDKEDITDMVLSTVHPSVTLQKGHWSFKFGEGYELCFEPLIWGGQMYVALYKDFTLLTEKVVIKPGYVKNEHPNEDK